jgi:hypothetical protein
MLRYVTRPGTTTELVVLQVILAAIWLATSTSIGSNRCAFGQMRQNCRQKVDSSLTLDRLQLSRHGWTLALPLPYLPRALQDL